MHYNLKKWLPACFFILLIGGCLSIKHPYQQIDYYTLEYDYSPTAHFKPLPLVLRIERFQVAPVYNTSRIIYRNKPYTRDAYAYRMWRSNPGSLVSYFLARDFRQSSAFKSVIAYDGSLASSHIIEGIVDEFYEHDAETSWEAVLAISITLSARNESDVNQKILFQKTYHTRENCRHKNPQALAEAMSKAMARLSAAIITDIYNRLAGST